MRTVLIGQAPSKNGDPHQPLSGRIGRRLAKLAGLTESEYVATFERMNVLQRNYGGRKNGKGDAFPRSRARAKALRMMPELRDRTVIFLGRETARAFGHGGEFFTWEWVADFRAAAFPHPSGLSHWWNDKRNVKRASRFLKRLILFS